MTKLEKNSMYSQLADLFDIYKPQEIPSKIHEVIAFIKNNSKRENDLGEMMESLLVIKQAFEESLIEIKSWSLVLYNPSRGFRVNLTPIIDCLESEECHAPIISLDVFFKILKEDLARYCLNETNVKEYKSCLEILNILENHLNYLEE
jgi:hypothetical protein